MALVLTDEGFSCPLNLKSSCVKIPSKQLLDPLKDVSVTARVLQGEMWLNFYRLRASDEHKKSY